MSETSEVWSEAHARRILEAWSKSGLTMTEFARCRAKNADTDPPAGPAALRAGDA